jgi:hypothetical protein
MSGEVKKTMSSEDDKAGAPRVNERLAEQVADPEAFNQKQRLKEIHKARRNFHDRRQRAKDLKVEGEINYRQYTDLLVEAFQRYFYELEGLMQRHSRGEHYLYEVELGELDPLDKDGVIEFTGLMSLAGSVPTVAVNGYSMDDKRGSTSERQILTVASETIVMRAFRECNKFLAEAGLDAEMEDDNDEATADYSDILDD